MALLSKVNPGFWSKYEEIMWSLPLLVGKARLLLISSTPLACSKGHVVAVESSSSNVETFQKAGHGLPRN
jgi:hypothetical protein